MKRSVGGAEENDGAGNMVKVLDCLREGVAVTDMDGIVVYCNPCFAKLGGIAPADCLGTPLQKLFTGTSLAAKMDLWRSGIAAFEDVETTASDGRRRWLRLRGARSVDDDSRPLGLVVTVVDHTSAKQLADALKRSIEQADTVGRQLQAVLDAVPVGLAVYARDGEVARANRWMLALWGQRGLRLPSAADLKEMDCRWVLDDRPVDAEEWPAARLLAGEERVAAPPMSVSLSDGGRQTVLSTGIAIRGADGMVAGAVMASIDLTPDTEVGGCDAATARLVEVVESLGRNRWNDESAAPEPSSEAFRS